ncbi:OB-fold putative lipoprotein [Citrobacter sp. MNAZ 1397]|uniref:OB-fold putative lipoprotein n=1 Tax=Citrobacter sp. MNAZ 1397 TaxID=2911205 RepID=UPI0020272B24|nr:OB-fold putative lipoprotein [Citrobacter sp. MNAZ 1397]MCL9670031.1 OB-fold putative lipoprotein [Citrobacter sp. MNAZ 1397]
MRKVIALPLVLASFTSITQGAQSGEIQPYPDYLAAYVKTLVTAGCEQALKGDSEDALIKQVTQGMKKGTPSYNAVYNSVVEGADAGTALKSKGRLITKDKIAIDSCGGVAAYISMQQDFMKMVVDEMTTSAQSQSGTGKPKATSSDESVYRTTAKELVELYKANEVAADDNIGGRKVEVTGTVQDITKNFANDVVLKLESDNRFMPVSLSMADSEKAQASKLKKGQKIIVTCEKMQFFIGAPSGGNCTFN